MKVIKRVSISYKSKDGREYKTKKQALKADKIHMCKHDYEITCSPSSVYYSQVGAVPTLPCESGKCRKCGDTYKSYNTSGKNLTKIPKE